MLGTRKLDSINYLSILNFKRFKCNTCDASIGIIERDTYVFEIHINLHYIPNTVQPSLLRSQYYIYNGTYSTCKLNCTYICMYVCMYVRTYVCVYVCAVCTVCMYVYIRTYVRIYVCTHRTHAKYIHSVYYICTS